MATITEHKERGIKGCYYGDCLQNTKDTGLRAVIVATAYRTLRTGD